MSAKGPYGHDCDELPGSQEMTDPVMLLKLELGAKFCKIAEKMEAAEVLELTGLAVLPFVTEFECVWRSQMAAESRIHNGPLGQRPQGNWI